MKYRTAALAAAGVVAVGLAAVFTANAEGFRHGDGRGDWRGHHARGHHGNHGQMGRHFPLFFDLLDIDADNTVTRTEAMRPADQRFERADGDGDGYLTAGELEAARVAEPGRFDGRLITRLDADGDERVSAAEFAVMARAVFARADANDDGTVSFAEFNAVRQGMHGRGHAMARPGGGDRPGLDDDASDSESPGQ